MRIRKSASRLLGSAYSAFSAPSVGAAPPFDLLPPPAPPARLVPCSAPESCGGTGFSGPFASSAEPCELSRSPWDLVADLSVSDDPQVEDELMDKYFVHVTTRSSWLFSATMPAASSSAKKKKLQAAAGGDGTKLPRDTVKKPAISKEKEGDANKKAKVKKEEGQKKQNVGAARVWLCKKNDGKKWHCNRPVSQPNTYCEYHYVHKPSYLNDPDFEFLSVAKLEEAVPVPAPAPVAAAASKSKSTTRIKRRRKKPGSDHSATEGFYYYAGFGPFRSKRQCRSGGGMNGPVPAKQEEDHAKGDDSSPRQTQGEVDEGHHDDTNQTATAARGDAYSSEDEETAGIAGVDEGSSDDDSDGLGMNGNGDPKATSNGKRKIHCRKRWRKPVKARSLKSLM